MAYFAKIGTGNKVLTVETVHNDIATTEQAGIDFLNNLHNTRDVWKQTSYNTVGGKHYTNSKESADQSKAFRGNYAGIGSIYDSTRDVFIGIQPFNSWILNETTFLWEAPVAYPDDGKKYKWNEETKQWDLNE